MCFLSTLARLWNELFLSVYFFYQHRVPCHVHNSFPATYTVVPNKSDQKEEPRPKKALQVQLNVKLLPTVFFDCNGVMHHEFLRQGRTVNKEYCLEVRRRLRKGIRQKCAEFNHEFCTLVMHQLTWVTKL